MTPFIDVMLVLLIIFMVTAPLLTAGVPVNLPDSRAKPLDQDQKPVQVSLDASGKIFVDKDEVTEALLPDLFRPFHQVPHPVTLRPDLRCHPRPLLRPLLRHRCRRP